MSLERKDQVEWCRLCDRENLPGVIHTETAGSRKGQASSYCNDCWESGLSALADYGSGDSQRLARGMVLLFAKLRETIESHYVGEQHAAPEAERPLWRQEDRSSVDRVATVLHDKDKPLTLDQIVTWTGLPFAVVEHGLEVLMDAGAVEKDDGGPGEQTTFEWMGTC